MDKKSIVDQAEELSSLNKSIKSSSNPDSSLISRRDELIRSLMKASKELKSQTSVSESCADESMIRQANVIAEINKKLLSCKNKDEQRELLRESIRLNKALHEQIENLSSTRSISNSEQGNMQTLSMDSQKTEKISVSGSENALKLLNKSLNKSQNESLSSSSLHMTIDIAFLIDATKSMQPWIDSLKDNIKLSITKIKEKYSNIKFRVAYVAYRDFDMGDNSYEIFDFTKNPTEMEQSLAKLKAKGGGDAPEDINGAIQILLCKLNWTGDCKILVHFADAPCHGTEFHDLKDENPNPSSDIPWDKLLSNLRKNGIHYNFMELNKSTRKMTDNFSTIWKKIGNSYPARFKVYSVNSMNAADLIPHIKTSIKDSIDKSFRTIRDSITGNKVFLD